MKQLLNKKATYGFLFAIGLGATLSAQWQLTGNAITNPATQFIGTTTNQPLVFRTNNVERFRIVNSNTGRIVINNVLGTTWSQNLYIGGGNDVLQTQDGLAGNTAVGYGTLLNVTTGQANTAYGLNALGLVTTGWSNTAIGIGSQAGNKSGNYNSSVGSNSLSTNENGENNVAFGTQALFYGLAGDNNVAIGRRSLSALGYNRSNPDFRDLPKPEKSNNIAIGFQAMDNVRKANNNIVIGTNALSIPGVIGRNGNFINNIVVGNNIVLPDNSSNQLNIGNWIVGNNGIIGIGSFTTPLPNTIDTSVPPTGNTYRLFVKDGIRTEKVKVDIASANDWADFVFKKGYNLMPLEQVEAFIKENQHLPEIPSEKQVVEQGGIELKEMNVKLLQKIEELTLHLIEQNKRIKELENKQK